MVSMIIASIVIHNVQSLQMDTFCSYSVGPLCEFIFWMCWTLLCN